MCLLCASGFANNRLHTDSVHGRVTLPNHGEIMTYFVKLIFV